MDVLLMYQSVGDGDSDGAESREVTIGDIEAPLFSSIVPIDPGIGYLMR